MHQSKHFINRICMQKLQGFEVSIVDYPKPTFFLGGKGRLMFTGEHSYNHYVLIVQDCRVLILAPSTLVVQT